MSEMVGELAEMQGFVKSQLRSVPMSELREMLVVVRDLYNDGDKDGMREFLSHISLHSPMRTGSLFSMALAQTIANRLMEAGEIEVDL